MNRFMKISLVLLLSLLPFLGFAQKLDKPFKGHFYNKKMNIHLQLDAYDTSLTVPSYEFLGTTHGYMHGNIYGIWLITRTKIKDNVAHLRLSNDLGADAQSIELTLLNDDTLHYNAIGGNDIKRIEKRKLVKISSDFILVRQK